MLCYNNRPPMLSFIPVIYNSLGQNKSKELELWPNNEYEIRPYSFQKISSVTTKLETDQGLQNGGQQVRGSGEWKGHSPWWGVRGKAPKPGFGCGAPNSLLFSNQRSYFIGKFCIMPITMSQCLTVFTLICSLLCYCRHKGFLPRDISSNMVNSIGTIIAHF